MQKYIYIFCNKQNLTREILQEGFRVDVNLVRSPWEGMVLITWLPRLPNEGNLKISLTSFFDLIIWFWTQDLLSSYFAICHHPGFFNCTESGLIHHQKMNAFLQNPFTDCSLISSSPLPVKYIAGKNRERLKLLFFLFYLIPFGIFIEL